jgi:hypothetical protein
VPYARDAPRRPDGVGGQVNRWRRAGIIARNVDADRGAVKSLTSGRRADRARRTSERGAGASRPSERRAAPSTTRQAPPRGTDVAGAAVDPVAIAGATDAVGRVDGAAADTLGEGPSAGAIAAGIVPPERSPVPTKTSTAPPASKRPTMAGTRHRTRRRRSPRRSRSSTRRTRRSPAARGAGRGCRRPVGTREQARRRGRTRRRRGTRDRAPPWTPMLPRRRGLPRACRHSGSANVGARLLITAPTASSWFGFPIRPS